MKAPTLILIGLCLVAAASAEQQYVRKRASESSDDRQQRPLSLQQVLHQQAVLAEARYNAKRFKRQVRPASPTEEERRPVDIMTVISNLIRDSPPPQYSAVRFQSRWAQTIMMVLRMIQHQIQAFVHLMRALSPLDTILSDPTWRSAQTAMMRQDTTADTFNTILDVVLRVVRMVISMLTTTNSFLGN